MMQKNENPIVLSVVLLLISAVVALLLAFTNSVTKDKIELNTINEQNAAKQEVLPQATTFGTVAQTAFSDNSGIVKAIYEGKNEAGELVGWCVSVAPSGYGGVLDIMVGINTDQTISGMKVVSHSETAGLGAKASEPAFSGQFSGKPTDSGLTVIKNGTPKENEIVAISGATITSKAVTEGVNAAVEAIEILSGGGK